MTRNSFRKISFILITVVLSGTLYLSTTYATLAPLTPPPSGGYDAGSNSILDPGCEPDDTDCFVNPITADNGLTVTGSNVQLGGTLLQNTLIDQDGNDLNITNGNFSFESDSDLLGFGITGIGLTYNNGTEQSLIGMVDDPAGRYPALYYYNSDVGGTGTVLERQISTGDVGIGLTNTETYLGTTYWSGVGIGGSDIGLGVANQTINELIDIRMSVDNINPVSNGIRLSHENVSTTGNAYFVNINSETGVTFDSYTGSSYTFPLADGTTNQVLATDGAGQISWVDGSWKLTGNAGTTPGTNFIGTTDAQDFVIKVNNNEMGRFYKSTGTSAGSIALGGGTAPSTNMFVYGSAAGTGATNATTSNFIGFEAGNGATNSSGSNFIGYRAGKSATGASSANFIGVNSGFGASNADFSNFIGVAVGLTATDAQYSNFVGYTPGQGATFATYSNFFGYATGQNAINASNSNFFGQNAGLGGTNSDNSNFIGQDAGRNAANSPSSNFIGTFAGSNATQAAHSNFIGDTAGNAADLASYSNFIGSAAGSAATTARNSIFIGKSAGVSDTVDNTTDPDDFSILIGNNTSTGGFENSIALGANATNTASNQFMIGSATRPIDTTRINGSASTQCTITTGTGIACTSDERVKTNITDLTTNTLDKLLNVKTVTYNWLQNPTSKTQIGFLAQDLEQYFPELVETDSTGMKSVYYAQMSPILVEAIREMNLNITDINNTETPNTWRDSLIAWFGNVGNGITDFYAKVFHADRVETKQLCLDDLCITKDQLQTILNNNQIVPSPSPAPTPTPEPTTGDDIAPSGNDDQTPPADNPSDDGTDTGSSDQVITPPADTPPPADTSIPTE